MVHILPGRQSRQARSDVTYPCSSPGPTLSARIAAPAGPSRGLFVALHGGTYDAQYYDTGPESLLARGPATGFTVAALDRPGYGAATDCDPAAISFAGQAPVLAGAVDTLAAAHGAGCPIMLIGHSIGGMLTLLSAPHVEAPLAGVEVSGLGEHWQPGLREMWSELIGDAPSIMLPADAHAEVMFGPAETCTPEAVELDAALLRAMPMAELIDVVTWSALLPRAAEAITVPVSVTLAEHGHIWRADGAARCALAAHFTSSPSVTARSFPGTGHSIELHRSAAAYVDRQLRFAAQSIDAEEPAPVIG